MAVQYMSCRQARIRGVGIWRQLSGELHGALEPEISKELLELQLCVHRVNSLELACSPMLDDCWLLRSSRIQLSVYMLPDHAYSL